MRPSRRALRANEKLRSAAQRLSGFTIGVHHGNAEIGLPARPTAVFIGGCVRLFSHHAERLVPATLKHFHFPAESIGGLRVEFQEAVIIRLGLVCIPQCRQRTRPSPVGCGVPRRRFENPVVDRDCPCILSGRGQRFRVGQQAFDGQGRLVGGAVMFVPEMALTMAFAGTVERTGDLDYNLARIDPAAPNRPLCRVRDRSPG